jgi:hypothetical protein
MVAIIKVYKLEQNDIVLQGTYSPNCDWLIEFPFIPAGPYFTDEHVQAATKIQAACRGFLARHKPNGTDSDDDGYDTAVSDED